MQGAKRILAVFAMSLCFALLVAAQGTSQIQGVVQDTSGAAVPGAEVKAIQTDTGASRSATSGADGGYVLPNLPIGPYRLEITKQGFTTYVQTGIVLQVNVNPTIDVSMKVGQVNEQVQVEANAALVETQATGIGQVIENKRILELPLNGRVATDLIQLTGAVIPQGVAGNGGYPGTQQFVINGGQAFGAAFWLDGTVYNNPWDSANLPFPFPDALQEFKVETSALTAQNGVHAGGSITAVTRSGANAFHGNVFEFFRNGELNARNFFAPARDTLKRNQYGGTVGGPIKKDKLFFFFGYQNTIVRQDPVATQAFVPTAAMLAGDFTACPSYITPALAPSFPGNKLRSDLSYDSAALNLASRLPKSNDPCGKYFTGNITKVDENQVVGRGDYQTSAKNSLFGRYIRSHYYRPSSYAFSPDNILTTSQGALNDADQSYAFGDTYLFSPTIVNQFRASVNRVGIHRYADDFVSACDVGAGQGAVAEKLYCGYVPHQSTFAVTNAFTVGPGTGTEAQAHSTIYQLNNDVSWVKGSHQINFGVGGAMYNMIFLGTVYAQTSWTFPGLPQFLLGQFSLASISAPNPLYQRKWFVNGYAQDTWKVSPRLTVNLGLRWEPFLPPIALNNAVYNFNMADMIAGKKSTVFTNAPAGLTFPGDPGFQGQSGMNKQWGLFAPRVAIGYDPTGSGKMSIRASFGIAYDYVNGQLFVNAADAPPFGNTEQWAGKFSDPYATNPGGSIFPYTVNKNVPFVPGGAYLSVRPDMKTMRSYQWNFAIQRQLGNDWLVSATYTGSESAHIWGSYQQNPGLPSACAPGLSQAACNGNINSRRLFTQSGYPNNNLYGYVDTFDDGGTSSYNGLLLSVQKRLSKGLSISANYTWSHCIGDLSVGNSTGNTGAGYIIPNNRRLDRSNCQSIEIGGVFSSDRRQLFNSTAVYETPKFSNAWARRLGSNWKISGIYRAQSAAWLSVSMLSDVSLTGASAASQRPVQLLQNPLCANPGPNCWINPAAFGAPAQGTLSTMGRSNVPGPAFWQIDGSVSREFAVHEAKTLEVRADLFNFTNSYRAGVPPPSLQAGGSGVILTVGSPTFGKVLTALDPRIIQLAMKFTF
jgi:hypothetical protein